MHARSCLHTYVAGLMGCIFAAGSVRAQSVLYVDAEAAGPMHDGSNWCEAYLELSEALTVAVAGHTIRVADGTYTPNTTGLEDPREATFQLLNGVTIEGGYAGCGALNPNKRDIDLYETVLSGDLAGDDGPDFANNAENSYHVVTGSGTEETAVLDGLTITAGNANGPHPHDGGGGMHNGPGSSPTLTNCTFMENSASSYGAGMHNSSSNPALDNCTFSANSSWFGGGMANLENSSPTLADCVFSGNSASGGGGMSNHDTSNATLTNCTFIDNAASPGTGGGIHNFRSSLTLVDCVFSGNSASGGGGIANHNSSNATLTDCTFIENAASPGAGGGIHNHSSTPTLAGCVFSGNQAGNGGGMSNHDSSNPTLTDCTFAGNSANQEGGAMLNDGSGPILTDCTFQGNSAHLGGGMYNQHGSSPTLTNCTFHANSGAAGGGGMTNMGGTPTLSNCTFIANSGSMGGGVLNTTTGNLTFTDCAFTGNSADSGGGMYNTCATTPTLIHCTFTGNSARYLGGGMFTNFGGPTVVTCLFSQNSSMRGGGMYNDYCTRSLPVINSTFSGNSAEDSGGGVFNRSSNGVTMDNCILWGNSDRGGADESAQIYNEDNEPPVNHCCIQGWTGALGGTGNIGNDPLFVPGPDGCFYLSQTDAGETQQSACVDAGNDTAANLGLDTMTTRSDEITDNGVVDMGYHYPVTGLPLVMGDYDRSGRVDLSDFAAFQRCFTGIRPNDVIPCCRIFDFEPDTDIDLDDAAEFQATMHGP